DKDTTMPYDRASMMDQGSKMLRKKSYLIVLLSAALGLSAQVTTATLYTIATDPSGAVIRGVVVTLRSEATGTVRQQSCDDVGECSFTFLPPGSYTASIHATG